MCAIARGQKVTPWQKAKPSRSSTHAEGHKGAQRVACAYLSSLLGGSTRPALQFVGHMRAIEAEEGAGNSEIMKAH